MKKPLFLLFMLASTQLPTLAQEADRDTTIVVPETGYLPIHPSRNFTTEQKGIIVCSLFGSNTSGLSFTKYALDSVVVGSSLNSSCCGSRNRSPINTGYINLDELAYISFCNRKAGCCSIKDRCLNLGS